MMSGKGKATGSIEAAQNKYDNDKDNPGSNGQDSQSPTSPKEPRPPRRQGLGPRPVCFNSTVTEVLFVLTTTAAIMASSFVTGILTVISNIIAEDLHMTQAQVSWLTASLTLAGGPTLLFFGRLADLFGRNVMFIGSFFLFAVFALAASFSKDAITIDTLNGVLGLISAAMVTPAAGALGYSYERPSKRKNYAFACYSAGNPIGFVFGTLFGGLATQIFNWQAAYRLVAIIYLIFTVIAYFTVPKDDTVKQKFNMEAVRRFDVVGTLFIIVGIGMLTTALTLGGESTGGWKTAKVLCLLLIGLLLIILFVPWEMKHDHPLVPMWIWKDRDFSLLVSILLLGFMAFATSSFWIALFYQRQGHSALKVAVYLLPMVVVGLSINIIAGAILHKVSNKLLMYIGTSAYVVAFLLLSVQRSGDSYFAFTFPSLLIITLGADFQFNVVNMYVMTTLPRTQQSIAGGIFQTVARLCTTVGFGITTAVFNAITERPPQHGYYGNDPIAPYAGTFWFGFGCVVLSMFMVPFLRVGTQGHFTADEEKVENQTKTESKVGSKDITENSQSSNSEETTLDEVAKGDKADKLEIAVDDKGKEYIECT